VPPVPETPAVPPVPETPAVPPVPETPAEITADMVVQRMIQLNRDGRLSAELQAEILQQAGAAGGVVALYMPGNDGLPARVWGLLP